MQTRSLRVAGFGTLALAMLVATSAYAVDGVIEINQAKALAGGVTIADTPGFPVTLWGAAGASRSYRLTSDLVVADANTTAIELPNSAFSPSTTIDLNGFRIIGPTTCGLTSASPPSVTCSGAGTGSAIAGVATGLIVKNGFIEGMGSHGISVGGGTYIDLKIRNCGGNGIDGPAGEVRQVSVVAVGGDGIRAGAVVGSKVSDAGGHGVYAVERAIDNLISAVAGDGIAGSARIVRGNVLSVLGGRGIAFGGGVVSGNSVSGCGLANVAGTTEGITVDIPAAAGAVVTDNLVADCTGFGIVAAPLGYARNVLVNNNGGNANPQTTGGFETGTNVCGFDTVCP